MHITVDEFIRRLNAADDVAPKFLGTYHITTDDGEFINNPDVRFLARPGRPALIIDARD